MPTTLTPADARLEELSSDLVTHAARLVRALRRLHDLPAGIRVLSLLDELGPMSVTGLARADRCSQPTMSSAVARLMDSGDVSKEADPDDGRCTVIRLTARGRRSLSDVRRLNGASVAARVAESDLHSAEDLAVAVAVLRDLVDPLLAPSERASL